jgi:triosephosphate isomerase
VGHSERRTSGDTDTIVAAKCRAALAAGLNPIVCVGESLAEREAGSAEAVVRRQLRAVLGELSMTDCARLTLAYEPVWAIGTGRTATPAEAQAMHRVLRGALVDVVGGVAASIRLLYGGSVTPANAAALQAEPDVDGVLVGGASLVVEKLLDIADALRASAG